MRKGAGFAVLAIASIYLSKKQLEKRKNSTVSIIDKSKESKSKINKALEPKINKALEPKINKVKEVKIKSPIDIIREQDIDVFIVGNGTKYHIDKDCRGIRKNSNVKKMKLHEAKDKEYTLCKWESKKGE